MTNEQPELDRIIAALRSAAHSSELGGEDAAVDAMASTLASTPATVHSVGSPRSLRVVAVVAASLIGMGGIAAAGAATLGPAQDRDEIRGVADTVVDTTTPDTAADTTTPDTAADTTTPDAAVDVATVEATVPSALVDDPTTDFDETQCAEGNHGATVSSIAKETPPGPDHGDAVSEAAQSSCGKDTDDTVTDDTSADLVDDPTTDFDETQCADGNHGATVSSIAKETPPGPDHGDAVSEAAQSSCGKSTTDDDPTDDDSTAATVASTTDDDSPGNGTGNGNANGNGNGNGNNNGNGNGDGNGNGNGRGNGGSGG